MPNILLHECPEPGCGGELDRATKRCEKCHRPHYAEFRRALKDHNHQRTIAAQRLFAQLTETVFPSYADARRYGSAECWVPEVIEEVKRLQRVETMFLSQKQQ